MEKDSSVCSDTKKYWETRLHKQYNLRGVGFIGLSEKYNAWLYRLRRLVFLRCIRSLGICLESARVLDVGSGTGFYIDRWQELGVDEIVGLDLTEMAVRHLRIKYPSLEFHQADICDPIVDLSDKTFDVVSAFDVLFHIISDDRYDSAIRNIYSLLTPGGWFVFSENFVHSGTLRSMHQVSRSKIHIERCLADNGFQIIGRFPQFYLMNAPLDSSNLAIKTLWKIVRQIASASEVLGYLLGGCLFPIELALVSHKPESPSTEIMVCQKPS